MLTREQVEKIAGEMWDKAEEVGGVDLLLGEWDRERYISEVLKAFDSSDDKQLLPLDAAIQAVRRAEAKGVLRYRATCEEEYEGPEGCFASGDDEQDRETCEQIRKDYDNGNDWAWCSVIVSCSIPGYSCEGKTYLGCCSYASKEDFCQPGGYYDDMKHEARAALISAIADEIVEERKRV